MVEATRTFGLVAACLALAWGCGKKSEPVEEPAPAVEAPVPEPAPAPATEPVDAGMPAPAAAAPTPADAAPDATVQPAAATPTEAVEEAPAPVLMLDRPTLRLAEPPAGGLHLNGGALDRDVQLRFRVPVTPEALRGPSGRP